MADRIKLRRDTAANWTATDPVLAQGEPGFETDTDFLKVGDGVTAWNDLSYVAGVGAFVSKTGDTMTGPLSVPAGASGTQVPQAQEILHHTFPAGTKMLFAQTAAPTGWTKDTTHNNKALRVVTGTAGSGGSVAFTTAFASQAVSGTVGNTTLTVSQIPNHNHVASSPGLYFFGGADNASGPASGPGYRTQGSDSHTGFNGGGGSHNHAFTGTAINLAVQYVDVIIATKD